MAIPVTKLYLATILVNGGYRYTPEAPNDFAPAADGTTGSTWVASIADLNGDLLPEVITGSPGSDDKATDAGRVYVTFGSAMAGTSGALGDTTSEIIIDGGNAGDNAGAAVGSITDLNGDGRAEILVGAPLMENGIKVDAGAAFVVWGQGVAGGIDLLDAASGAGNGIGYIIKGEAAGDHAGAALASIADLNGDVSHLAEVLVGAAGNDAGGLDAGAAYVVWGKASDAASNLTSVAAGSGGFRITGEAAGDAAGTALGTLADLNGDGLGEILVGAPGNAAGGLDAGAAYVVFGKSTGTEVSLATIAAGTGGFRITGQAGDHVGAAVGSIGDVNGDGLADILLGAPMGDHAYVVFGKASTTEVLLSDIAAGHGGYMISPEVAGDLVGMSITGGADFNHDGVADLVVGTPGNAEGGTNAGAVYVVWGGGNTNVDLSLVAEGIGGAKIVGAAGSMTGASVALAGDVNHDGNPDLLIGSPGAAGEAVNIVFDPASWQSDPNIYGTNGDDTMGAGFGGLHLIGDAADSIHGLGGDDSISAAGGDDSVDAGSGNDTVDAGSGDNTLLGGAGTDSLIGGTGNDSLDGGTDADTMAAGSGNDSYVVDNAGDVVTEAADAGVDTVLAGITYTLGANLEGLVLTGTAHAGTGNELDNGLTASSGANTLMGMAGNDTLLGSSGNDSLDGGSGADSMAGDAGSDTYVVDNAGDLVGEALGGGTDTVRAALDYTLGANVEGLVLTGAAQSGTGNELANTLLANTTDSTLLGLAGTDTLLGSTGNDSLDGGTGADSMAGGAGNDTYVVENAGDVVSEALGGGNDTVLASIDVTLAVNVEALLLTGTAHAGTGNALDNVLAANDLGDTLSGVAGNDTLLGGSGNDSLDGGSGADSMAGGAGNDTYVVDNAGDLVGEGAAGGTDTVQASIDITLADDVEVLVLTAAGHLGTGNAGDNLLMAAAGGDSLAGAVGADTLLGNTGNDKLDGGSGADSMAGGAGHDTYVVDNAGDVVTEAAGAGNDTVMASIDITLADNVEGLVMTAAGHVGSGNALDNSLLGSSGADTLLGGAGSDTIDGNGGGDSLVGGDGNDTYIIRSPSDVVVETGTGGFDTVIVTTDWTLADNIEAVQLLGGAHALTGNAGNNQLSGSSSDDTLDGGGGQDTLLGGDGNDVLVASSGASTMDGGSGDDRYVLVGGAARVEDFLGNDTLDASQATGDTRLDLSERTASEVEGRIVEFGAGGTTAAPLDVQFLQDLTGSFADDIITVRGLVPQIVTALQAVQGNAVFGVSTFRDKPIGGFGAPDDWVYQQQLALSIDTTALTNAYTAMVANNGNDGPEAQIEALMQLALHSGDVGYRANAARFVVLFTDAPFHMAGDGAAAGIATPNNGDGIMDGTPPGTGEDYPLITQVKLALEAANIIPIFCIAGGYDATYRDLVTQLGRGAEVTLTANSSNIIAALNAGLTAATMTTIENAWGGEGNDTLVGGDIANSLVGNGGNDSLDGGAAADTMAGGMGNDTYMVDNAGDVVTELSAQGNDTVLASIDHTLAANVEALVLTGNAHAGIGNALDNSLTGGVGDDSLQGLDGNDTLDGGSGNNTLDGGTGTNQAIFHCAAIQVAFTHNVDGSWTAVTPDGTDTLVNIQQARFTDGSLALSLPTSRDFEAAGSSDILWLSDSGIEYQWHLGAGGSIASQAGNIAGAGWNILGSGDFFGDGHAAVLWRHTDGTTWMWRMNGSAIQAGSGPVANVDGSWSVLGIGDFTGDGKADIVWQHAGDNTLWLFAMDGTMIDAAHSGGIPYVGAPWVPVAVGAPMGLGRESILFQNSGTGDLYAWTMNGTAIAAQQDLGIETAGSGGTDWSVAGLADFNADSRADILLRSTSTGDLRLWQMNADGSHADLAVDNPGMAWSIAALGDYNGNGTADMLWRNSSTGEVYLWTMNGNAILGAQSYGNPGAEWHIAA